MAPAATEVGLNRASIADRDASLVRGRLRHFDSEFVAKNAGIGEKGLFSLEGVRVCTANAHPTHAHERVALGPARGVGMSSHEPAGFFKNDL